MKKRLLVATGALLLLSSGAFAQSRAGADYFAGTWNILVKDTPSGDARLFFVLNSQRDSLGGVVEDSTGAQMAPISHVDLSDTSATVYFTAQGYDVYLEMDRQGPDTVSGSMMGMFSAGGRRVKPLQQAAKP